MDQLFIRVTQRTEFGNRAIEKSVEMDLSQKPLGPVLIMEGAKAADLSAHAFAANSPAAGAAAERWTKVMADGTHRPGSDPTADHVAVIDGTTGLMWAVESLGDPKDADDGVGQAACIKRCEGLRLLGYDNWSLPTRAQLVSLIDDTRHEPAIDTNLFPRVKPRWHWTSTPCSWSPSAAWGVYFYNGGVDYYHRYYNGFALAVRRVGQ